MAVYGYTEYFEKEVLRKRPYLKKEWCAYVLENAVRSESQSTTGFGIGRRLRSWGVVT